MTAGRTLEPISAADREAWEKICALSGEERWYQTLRRDREFGGLWIGQLWLGTDPGNGYHRGWTTVVGSDRQGVGSWVAGLRSLRSPVQVAADYHRRKLLVLYGRPLWRVLAPELVVKQLRQRKIVTDAWMAERRSMPGYYMLESFWLPAPVVVL